MKTKEEILKSYQALALEVKEMNEATTDEKEQFHMFFIGGHITEENGDKFLSGSSHLIAESNVLAGLIANNESASEFMNIGAKVHISKFLENLGGNKND